MIADWKKSQIERSRQILVRQFQEKRKAGMADIFDKASDRTEEIIGDAINEVRRKAKNPDRYTGHCLYCNTEINTGGRFCPKEDCGEQWELEQEILRRQGQLRLRR